MEKNFIDFLTQFEKDAENEPKRVEKVFQRLADVEIAKRKQRKRLFYKKFETEFRMLIEDHRNEIKAKFPRRHELKNIKETLVNSLYDYIPSISLKSKQILWKKYFELKQFINRPNSLNDFHSLTEEELAKINFTDPNNYDRTQLELILNQKELLPYFIVRKDQEEGYFKEDGILVYEEMYDHLNDLHMDNDHCDIMEMRKKCHVWIPE